MFFAGSKGAIYRRVGREFGILDRCDILDFVESHLRLSVNAGLNAASLLIIVGDGGDGLNKHRLTQDDYLALLRQSHFVLCPPGWKVPHAHNLIEALAMGCVPIINYADLMTPPLRDQVNCLAFTTLEQLAIILETLPKLSLERIEAMRQEALDYYLLYLYPASVGRSLMASLPTITRVSFNDETGI
jgi:hypothetical protein